MKGLNRINNFINLKIGNKEISFKNKIFGIEVSEEKIFIILEPQMNKKLNYDEQNAVYCYNYDGNLLWQIRPPNFSELVNFKHGLYVAIYYDSNDNKFYASDFDGLRFEIDQDTGEPISYKQYR